MMRTHYARAALIIVLSCLTGSAFAQSFGLHTGLQKASIRTDEAKDTFGTEVGYTIGFFVDIDLWSNFGIITEAMYSQKIITQEQAGGAQPVGSEADVELGLGSIEIPVALVWKPPVEGRIQPRIYAGPVMSVIVNEKVTLTDKSIGEAIDEAFVLTRDAFADYDLGWLAGAGLSIHLFDLGITKLQLLADVRYVGGLTSVQKEFAGNPLRQRVGIGAFNAMVGVGL